MMIEADYNFPMSNHDQAVIRFAKVELDRLYKLILKSNCSIRSRCLTKNDINELYKDILYNDIFRLSSNIGSVRQQIEHVHSVEI